MRRSKALLVSGVCLAFATVCPAKRAAAHAAKPVAAKPAIDPAVLHMQVLLDRLGFTPGVIDGRSGTGLTLALKGFQQARDVPVTGQPDEATTKLLDAYGTTPGLIEVTLAAQDFAGPFVGAMPKRPEDQAKLPAMGYANVLEELAERFHTTPAVLIELNGAETPLAAGVKIKVPNVVPAESAYPETLKPEWRATLAQLSVSSDQPKAAKVVVDKSDGVLRVMDAGDKLVAQFPATMGSSHDPLPIGTWKIQGTSYLPQYHYNPKLFWDAKGSSKKELLQPGPNGPVGVVWMDLNKPHYGIHGTPSPETIGRAESHGCVRLTNWDAARLSLMVKPGTPAIFQP